MDYYESTLNDLVIFNVLDITVFCMLNKVLSAFVLPRSSITFSLVSDEYPPKTSIMMLYGVALVFDGVALVLLFEFPSQGCILSGLFLVLLLPVFYPGATHLYDLYCLCLLFSYPNIYSISSYFRTSCEYWYIPKCACFGVVVLRFRCYW